MIREKSSNLIPISQLGEFGLIDHITKKFNIPDLEAIVKGIGDDAAVLKFDTSFEKNFDNRIIYNERQQLISTDLLIEGVHFDLTYCPLKHLGYKSALVNFSDIFAMNGYPYAITVSLAVSNRFSVEAIEELYEGIKIACEEHNVDLIGGDTTSSRTGLCISVTVLGMADKNKITYRNNAQVNDIVCVTGDLGAAYAGLQLLEREKKIYMDNPMVQPDFTSFEYVIERQLRPVSRKSVIDFFYRENIIPTAMIDISDGLASEIHHICRQSNKGASLYQNKLPINYQTHKASELFEIPVVNFAVFGGEDYELLFTISAKDYDKISLNENISPIGHITDEPGLVNLLLTDFSTTKLEPIGFNHFSKK